jgi:hypothetical protein
MRFRSEFQIPILESIRPRRETARLGMKTGRIGQESVCRAVGYRPYSTGNPAAQLEIKPTPGRVRPEISNFSSNRHTAAGGTWKFIKKGHARHHPGGACTLQHGEKSE